jgi:hypothetical protein
MNGRLDNIEAQLALLTKMVDRLERRVTAADGGPVEVRYEGCVPDPDDYVFPVPLRERTLWW